METYKVGEIYKTDNGHTIEITGVEKYNPWGDCVYWKSETLSGGLIDQRGLYFLSNSIFSAGLTLIK